MLLLRSIRSCEYAKSWWSPKHLNATERFDAEFPRLKFLVALGSFTVLTSVVISYWIYHYKFSNLPAIREQLEALPLFSVFLLNLMIFLSSLVLSTLTKYKFRVTSIKSSIFRYSLLLGITASSFSLAFFTFVLDSWIPITSATVAATFIFFYILIVNNSKGWPDPINANADDLAILFVRTAIGIFLMLLLLSYKYGLVTLMIAMSVLTLSCPVAYLIAGDFDQKSSISKAVSFLLSNFFETLAFLMTSILALVLVIIGGAGYFLAIMVVVFMVRFLSVICALKEGIREWTDNWLRVMLNEDFFHEPRLIPGLGRDGAPVSDFIEESLQSASEKFAPGAVISLAFAMIVFLPAQLWRFSIKSTCWFYFPIYLLLNFGSVQDRNQRRHRLASSPTVMDILAVVYAVLVILIAVINAVNWQLASEQWLNIDGSAPFSPLGWWLVIDWSNFFDRPWQWFHLPALLITVVTFFWLDYLRKIRSSAKQLGDQPDKHYPLDNHPGSTIYLLQRVRQSLTTAAMVLGLWYFLQWAHQNDRLPTWILLFTKTIFGS